MLYSYLTQVTAAEVEVMSPLHTAIAAAARAIAAVLLLLIIHVVAVQNPYLAWHLTKQHKPVHLITNSS